MFVVVVFFEAKAAHVEEFKQAISINAKASVDDEPGCQLFDVSQDADDEASFFLYEIYDDEAAFKAHIATPHFKLFDELSVPWVKDKKVLTYGLIAKNRA
jgi:(4S)-4-hydroxy-5-phosphonooxypentane-2,3-dione isomerase